MSHPRPKTDDGPATPNHNIQIISGDDRRRTSPVESLPPELRLWLLSFLALAELQALVSASPVFHGQCVQDKRLLLAGCLHNTLGDAVTVDAHVVMLSSSFEFATSRSQDAIKDFLEAYRERHRAPMPAQSLASLGLDAILMRVSRLVVEKALVDKIPLWTREV